MDLSEKYLIWFFKSVPRSYFVDKIKKPEGIKGYELGRGKPLLDRWSSDAVCIVKDGDPKKPVLADSLINTDSQLIISERLKQALEALAVKDVEYLPVKIEDQKGKPLNITYYIVHLLNLPDCLDLEASEAEMSMIIDTDIDSLKCLAFKSDPGRELFRPSNYDQVSLVRWDMAEKLSEQGFSGIMWFPLFDHPEFGTAPKISAIKEKADALNEKIFNSKPVSIGALPAEKTKKRVKAPVAEVDEWINSLGDNTGNFQPMPGDNEWLDAYEDNPDDWPAFDPARYYCLGNDGGSNYYVLDLDDNASVVYYTHEVGYNEHENFEKVANNLEEFKKRW